MTPEEAQAIAQEELDGGRNIRVFPGRRAGNDTAPEPPPADDHVEIPLTPAAWMARNLPPPDCLMGDLFSTTSRVLFAADTGLGKSMFGLALAVAMHRGCDFLHWQARRAAKVLVIDGEMPLDLLQDRIELACGWFGVDPRSITSGLFILSREDLPDMPPLDSPEGAEWLSAFIKEHGGVDFIVFDNCMALTIGDLREEMTWRALVPLARDLSTAKVGQLWLHHTGHDKTRGYGSRVFAWQMDAVGVGEAVLGQGPELAFKLSWEKHRRRTPSNREDFATVRIQLADGVWTSAPDTTGQSGLSGPVRPTPAGHIALDALRKAIEAAGERPPAHDITNGVASAVTIKTWSRYFSQVAGYGSDDRAKEAERKAFSRARENCLGTGNAKAWGEWAWLA